MRLVFFTYIILVIKITLGMSNIGAVITIFKVFGMTHPWVQKQRGDKEKLLKYL